jgi:hypothetical protein
MECHRVAQRAAYASDPKIQARRQQIIERWRDEGLTLDN